MDVVSRQEEHRTQEEKMDYSYRGYEIEYIDFRNTWRLYRKDDPAQTVAYYDGDESLEDIKKDIDWHIENH